MSTDTRTVSLRAEERFTNGHHTMVVVWAGPDEEHRAHTGTLSMHPDEAVEFLRRVNAPSPQLVLAERIRAACTSGVVDGKACGICERIITDIMASED